MLAAMDACGTGIVLLSASGGDLRVTYMNRTAERLLDLGAVPYAGRLASEVVPRRLCDGWAEHLLRVASTGRGWSSETAPQGAGRTTLALHAERIVGETVVVSLRDVSEEVRLRAVAKLEEARLDALVRLGDMAGKPLKQITDFALEQAVSLTQSTIGYLAFTNEDESVLTMHSWSRAARRECEIVDKPLIYPVVTTGLWGEPVRQRRPVITNDYQAPSELKKGYPLGHVYIRRHVGVPVMDGVKIVAVAGVGNKETEYDASDVRQVSLLMEGMWGLVRRKRRDDELRESEQRYRSILDNMRDVYFRTDGLGRITLVSQSACIMLGVTSVDHIIGRQAGEFYVDPDERAELLKRLDQNDAVDDFEVQIKQQSGGALRASVTCRTLRDANGRYAGAEGILRDISQRKRGEDDVRRAQDDLERRVRRRTADLEAAVAELENFTYTVSHDLRAPLRAISGYVGIMRDERGDALDTDAVRWLESINSNAVHMGRLVDDLLEYTHLARRQFRPVVLSPRQVVDDVIAEVQAEVSSRRISIAIGELPDCTADAGMLRTVYRALMSNALKYTRKREDPEIVVASRRQFGQTVYCVHDNGVGFDPEYASRAFEVFQRLHRAEDYEGTGMGLAIARRIVERHGGRIWAEPAIGLGTTVCFTLEPAPAET